MKRPLLLPPWLLVPAVLHAQVPATSDPLAATMTRPEVQLQRVEIRGRAPTETDLRRESTAAKTVVGRDEIERYGDTTLSDVVKRLPGVTVTGTPGRGGEIRMRGMGGGYTQILINGERASGGLSVENLSPEQVERIEVYRAPTAETGAQAIAGTINIVLREDVRRRLNNVNLGLGWVDDRWQPTVNWTRADRLDRFSYNLNATLTHGDRANASDVTTAVTPASGAPGAALREERRRGRSERDALYLGGRMQWKPDADNTFALQPFLMYQQERDRGTAALSSLSGGDTRPYDQAVTQGRGHFAMARAQAEWQLRLPDTARLELHGGFTASESVGDSHRTETTGGTTTRLYETDSDAQERWRSSRGKYSRWVGTDHQWATGWELDDAVREEVRDTLQPLPARTARQDDLRADALRTAVWTQDEWKVSPQWALHGGMRWEQIRTRSDWVDTSGWQHSRNRSAVWSPLFHLLWRPEETSKDQVRLSLTRSYRAARPSQLTAQRVLNATGLNDPSNPDSAGNPALKPELSTGLDLAYEHYLDGGGLLSASIFHRQISDYIRNVVTLDSATGRYVSQPQNVGDARTTGLELEAKLRPQELWPALDWPLDVRAALGVFRSQVQAVAGPDNRLDRQPNYTLTLGADRKFTRWPLQLGASLSLQPSTVMQISEQQRTVDDMRRVVDAYALWTVDRHTAWRLSAGNLWARSTSSRSSFVTASSLYDSRTITDSTTLVALRLEMKL